MSLCLACDLCLIFELFLNIQPIYFIGGNPVLLYYKLRVISFVKMLKAQLSLHMTVSALDDKHVANLHCLVEMGYLTLKRGKSSVLTKTCNKSPARHSRTYL